MQTALSIPIFEQISACPNPAPCAVLGVQIPSPIFRQALSPAQRRRGLKPVSYTHLRAHETDSYL
eukprot:683913-Pleurochrysis_carterae.AAC.1